MNKLLLFTSLLFLTISCNQNSEKKAIETEKTETDISYFDYVAKIEFENNRNDLSEILPSEKTATINDADALAFQINYSGIEQSATFLFYGYENFSEGLVSLEFSPENFLADQVFARLTNALENKLGKPSTSIYEDGYEVLEWQIKQNNQKKLVKLEKEYVTINYTMSLLSVDESDVVEEDGEWVQVGEDGRWVFVPNN